MIEWSKSTIIARHWQPDYYRRAFVRLTCNQKFSIISQLTDQEAEAIANELGYQLQVPVQQISSA